MSSASTPAPKTLTSPQFRLLTELSEYVARPIQFHGAERRVAQQLVRLGLAWPVRQGGNSFVITNSGRESVRVSA